MRFQIRHDRPRSGSINRDPTPKKNTWRVHDCFYSWTCTDTPNTLFDQPAFSTPVYENVVVAQSVVITDDRDLFWNRARPKLRFITIRPKQGAGEVTNFCVNSTPFVKPAPTTPKIRFENQPLRKFGSIYENVTTCVQGLPRTG